MTKLPRRPNPYCAFKNDRERRLALLARDIRLVLLAAIGVLGSTWMPHFAARLAELLP